MTRKNYLAAGFTLITFLIALLAFGQSPNPTDTPMPTPTLISTTTPTPIPSVSISPNAGTVSVPSTLGGSPSPVASLAPLYEGGGGAVESSSSFAWSEKGAPTFTVDQAVITALRQNPQILNALEQIKVAKGVIIEIRAEVLPHAGPDTTIDWVDHNLQESSSFSTFGGGGGVTPTPVPGSGIGGVKNLTNDLNYNIKVTGKQLVFNYSTYSSLRGTFFQRDSAYFALRNTVDSVIATVKTEFYQVILNRELIVVQEESVRLLESQLKDQQNRFEAGTVPRFNVLQAQVQLSNQIPNLIAARNNYRISILVLAKTLGLDFNPARGIASPLRAVGELPYIPRHIDLLAAVEEGKRNRPFLKQQRANVLNQIEQVHVAIGTWLPNITGLGGGEWLSSQFNSSWGDIRKGWIATGQGSWDIWDSGAAYGRIKQQRAILSQQEITYDDDVRQVELEVQTAASNLLQNRELILATEKNVEQAEEAVRLAKARLDAGAGTQLDVLNAQVQLTTAQSTRLQALFGYNSSLAEFDRATGTQSTYTEQFDPMAPHSTQTRTYYTGSDVDARGKPKRGVGFETTTTTTTRTTKPSSK